MPKTGNGRTNTVILTEVDRDFYRTHLADFLPPTIIDVHTHIWPARLAPRLDRQAGRVVTWPSLVALDNPIEEHLSGYRTLFPDREVTPLVFSNLIEPDTADDLNDYVQASALAHGLPSLLFTVPDWSAEELRRRVLEGGHIGIKPYLSLAPSYIPRQEIRVFDFLPRHQLEAADKHGWIVMLHVPRDGRIRDPVNLAQLQEIERTYSHVRLIVAHVGRAYCDEDMGDAFRFLKDTEGILFDLSANTNDRVFEELIRSVGPRRILFGSDLPITRMRMRRICENGVYINLVPTGLYGDVAGDPHMREVSEDLTLFLYEEIAAFRRAAERTNLGPADVEAVFHSNAAELIERARNTRGQLHMVHSGTETPHSPRLPPGYRMRTFNDGDEQPYTELMRKAGFARWTSRHAARSVADALPDGLLFVVDEGSGNVVATAAASHKARDHHPAGGELGWVAADPAHQGKGLGFAVCSAALARFRSAGYRHIYLLTDDERLPAIKTYWKLGFRPYLVDPSHEKRWKAVCRQLDVEYQAL